MTKIPKLDSNNNEVIVEHKSTRKTNSISRPDYDYELKELHPFISSIKRDLKESPASKILLFFTGLLLIPFRLPILCLTWILISIIFTFSTPIIENTWRSKVRTFCCKVLYRIILWCHGVWYIEEVNGPNGLGPNYRPDPEKSKILVVAPHSTVMDGLHWVFIATSAVIKMEFAKVPVISKSISAFQPIYVDREIQSSRQKTAQAILNHVSKPNSLPLCFFPEGTCTNAKSLIHFKPGAFIAGLPVHPVLIKFPESWPFSVISKKINLSQWSLIGGPDNVLMTTLLMLAVPFQRTIIKWLPVYYPSEQEKLCPELYAHNVQKLMAKEYNSEFSDYILMDGLMLRYFRDNKLDLNIIKEIKFSELFDFLGEQISMKNLIKIVETYRKNYDSKCQTLQFSKFDGNLSTLSEQEVSSLFKTFLSRETKDAPRLKYFKEALLIDDDSVSLHKYIYLTCIHYKSLGLNWKDYFNRNVRIEREILGKMK